MATAPAAPPTPPPVEWAQLSDVERTCLGVAVARWHCSAAGSRPICHLATGLPLYTDPLGPLFVRAIPPDVQEALEVQRMHQEAWISRFVAIRTTELDEHIRATVQGGSVRQMVLLGAGMDTRAWRLDCWPPGSTVFEVDSEQVLAFKNQVLLQGTAASLATTRADGGGPLAAGRGGPEAQQPASDAAAATAAVPPLSCSRRVTVVADASHAQELWTRLVAAGLDAAQPVLYVMEGFIGYLTRGASDGLLALLAARSAGGSKLLVTCPPTPDQRAQSAAALAQAEADAAAAAAATAAAAAEAQGGAPAAAAPTPTPPSSSSGSDSHQANTAAAAALNVSAVSHQPLRLHHSHFEEPTETADRVAAAGWQRVHLLTTAELVAKYGLGEGGKMQPIVIAELTAIPSRPLSAAVS